MDVAMQHGAMCASRMGGVCDCRVAEDVVSKVSLAGGTTTEPTINAARRQLKEKLSIRAFSWQQSEDIVGLIEIIIEEKMRGN